MSMINLEKPLPIGDLVEILEVSAEELGLGAKFNERSRKIRTVSAGTIEEKEEVFETKLSLIKKKIPQGYVLIHRLPNETSNSMSMIQYPLPGAGFDKTLEQYENTVMQKVQEYWNSGN